MKKISQKKSARRRSMIMVLFLWASLFGCSMAASFYIENVIEDRCFQMLEENVKQGADSMQNILDRETQKLEILSDILAKGGTLDAGSCTEYLNALETDGLLVSCGVLLPDGEMIAADDSVTMEETPDFETEKEQESGFSGCFTDASGEKYETWRTPVTQDGQTVGILYGFLKLSALPEQLKFEAFEGQCQLYLIELTTGDYLMDTWHDTLGNFYDEELSNRKTKGGTNLKEARENAINGKSGYVIFVSATTGSDFYSYYTPVGNYSLSFQVTVPREVAFADAVAIQRIIFLLCIAQLLICMICFLCFLVRSRRKSAEAGRRLELNRAMNAADQMLFGAYKNPWMINEALNQMSRILGAEEMLYCTLDEGLVQRLFTWPVMSEEHRGALLGRSLAEENPQLFNLLEKDASVLLEKDGIQNFPVDFLLSDHRELRNFAAARILDPDGSIVGILSAANVSDTRYSQEVLTSLIRSFRLAVQILESYRFVHEMGTVDALTGLRNRNTYQHDLANCSEFENGGFCCVYIDANGLHDLNNQFGHSAGDKMLKTVGTLMREMFGSEHTYRIGGDEFVILGSDLDPEDMDSRLTVLSDRLAKQDYYVSIGCAFRESEESVHQVILAAEKQMYARKKEFYSGDRERRKTRQLNQSLENLLMEKRDQDNFLAAISAYYRGVYVVNLDIGDTRVIFRPDYFGTILEDNEFMFRSSMREYARQFVAEADFDAVIRLLDFGQLASRMKKGTPVECLYTRNDQIRIRIRILPMEDYAENQKNTLWIFEDYRGGDKSSVS